MSTFQRLLQTAGDVADALQSEEFQQFTTDTRDFISAREHGDSVGTRIVQMTVPLDEVPEVINRSFVRQDENENPINVISPVVIPKMSRSYGWIFWLLFWAFIGGLGLLLTTPIDIVLGAILGGSNLAVIFFGPHYWLLLLVYALYSSWRNSFVMVPDGCKALITQFGKLEEIAPAGRTQLFVPWNPGTFWRKVSYIVNTTKEYPYNAPIREAPTAGRVHASVDLFLQFRVDNPSEFIFSLGGAQGFTEKLDNVISEVTRALIYEQKAEAIYDLVGESTQSLLDALNKQFQPAVTFVNANITHAEPSSQQYRMDLAAPEMVRVAKEAYTYEYQLKLRKEQDEGDFNKDLAGLQETLSEIRAEIAAYQAQMDTAREKELNRANALAQQRLIEAESEANANAALLEAQALDIRAVNSAYYPEILEYRFQQLVLDQIEGVGDRLPQLVHMGGNQHDSELDYMHLARTLLGVQDTQLFSEEDIRLIRERVNEIAARIRERSEQLTRLMAEEKALRELAQATDPPIKAAALDTAAAPGAATPQGESNDRTEA